MKLLFNKNIITKTFSYKFVFKMFLISFLFYISGCVNENLTPVAGNVTVHLYDYKGFPGYIWHTFVSMGSYPLPYPDGNGNYYFKTSSIPYNLRFYPYYSTDTKDLIVYDGITHSENYLVPLFSDDITEENYVQLLVNYPTLNSNKMGLLKFTSNDIFSDWGGNEEFLYPDENPDYCEYSLFFPTNKSSISGKFIYFECYEDYYTGKVASYDKYFEKTITLNTDRYQSVTITNNDFKLSPGNAVQSYQVIMPQGSQSTYTEIYLNFDSFNTSSDFQIHYSSETNYSAVIPTGLPNNFKLKLHNFSYFGDSVTCTQEKWVYSDPGSTIIVDNSMHAELLLPTNNANNTCDSSNFSYSAINSPCVFYLRFECYYLHSYQTYITSKNKVTLGELKSNGFKFYPNTRYYWWVEQPTGFSSVDDYLSAPYLTNPNYNAKLASEVRTFTTAP